MARQLGSSVGILSASSRLREKLGRVLYLFRENAEDLFPNLKAKRQRAKVPVFRRLNKRRRGNAIAVGNKRRSKGSKEGVHDTDHHLLGLPPNDGRGHANAIDRKFLSAEMQAFARDISTLLECFSQFPDYVDEIPEQSLGQELKVCGYQLHSRFS